VKDVRLLLLGKESFHKCTRLLMEVVATGKAIVVAAQHLHSQPIQIGMFGQDRDQCLLMRVCL